MAPRLVLCRCDPAWPAFAVCERCELAWLEERLAAQAKLRPDHPAATAFGVLVSSVVARLPLGRPLDELAELLAAVTRCERGRGFEVDLRIEGDALAVFQRQAVAA